jgi:PAS domain S-box-containing protein
MRSRVALLNQKANQLSLPPQNFLEESFVELSTALEQLQVAQKELLQQNEELVTTRQALETQRQRYQELFDFAPDAYLVTDAQGTIQEANCAAAILLNISQPSLVGKVLGSFIPLEERKAFRSRLKQLSNKIGSVQEWEVRLYPRNTEPFDAAFRVAAFQDREHESVSLRCVVRDITLAKQTEKALQTAKQELEMKVEERTAQLRCVNERLRGEIAERQQAEAALRASEERFRSLVSNIPGAIYRCACDCDWTMEFISDAIQEISGYRATDFIHNSVRTFASLIHPEDLAMVERAVHKGLDARQPYIIEYRIIHADGSVRWVYEKGQGIFDEDGNVLYLDGAIFDISDRKQAEQKLRENEERFRSLSACSPVGIFLTDVESRCTYTNPRCQAICGFTLEESLGEGWSQSVHPEDRQRVFADWLETTREGRSYSDELRLQTKEGTVGWVHVRSSPMFSDKGELMGHVGTVEDITERKQALERLRESEHRWRTIIETEPECVKLVASDGTLLEMNAAGLAMLEAPSAEAVMGQSVYSLIAPEHREAFVALNENVCQGNRGTLEFEIIGLQGTRSWMETHAVPLRSESDGTLVHLAITRDITVRKQAEEELRQLNTALENAVEGISRLDTQGRYICVNKAYASTLGYQAEEMIGMAWQPTVHPDDLQKLVDAYQQMLKTGKAEVEARGVRKDGSIFYKQVVMVAAYDQQEQFIGHHCFAKDITDRKQAEAALKQAKQELEIRVEERTAQLRTANEQLLNEVAERKRAEVELERSLSLLRGTLEATADGIIVSQNGKHIATVNQKFIQMWGIPESVIASGDLNLLVPLLLEQLKESEIFLGQTQDVLSKADAEAYGIYQLKDGRIFERYSLPQRIGGKIVGRVCSFRDITERKQSEEALRQSEARYRAIVEDQTELICRFKPDGTLTFVNDAYCRYFSKKRSALMGHTFMPLILEEDQEKFDKYIACLSRENPVGTIEHRVILPNGQIRWQQWSDRALFDEQGNLVEFQSVGWDITDRKQAELKLQQSEQKYRNLFHNSLVGIFRNALADGMVLEANAAVLKMFGFDSYEGVKAVDLYVNPADRETLKQRLLEKGFVENFETQVRRKDGSVFWISYSGKLYAKEGYLEGVMIDITERKLAEEALQKAHDELESRVEERTVLLRQATARFRELALREALLNRLASQIRNSLALDTILETAVEELYKRLDIDVCVFAWYARESTPPGWDVVKEAKNPNLPSFLGLYPLESWRPFTCKLVNQQEFQVDKLTQSDDPAQQMLLPYGTAALLSLPIETQSGQLGTITCGRLVSWQSWTDEELELLQAVADQLVIAINQAQLYEQSRIAATTAQTKATQLKVTLRELQHTQGQLVQSEKMSSLGQLVAGVAHEINNPLNFIHGNLTHVHQYAIDLLDLIQFYQEYYPHPAPEIQAQTEAIDLDFIKEDLPKLLQSMEMGADRIRQIVLSLRNFSRLDEAEKKWVDIHEGLDNTLLILSHRLKGKPAHPSIEIIKEYGDLPKVQCYPGQLNQVFMNILSNAIDAIEEDNKDSSLEDSQNYSSTIRIRTEVNDSNSVIIRIADNGPGMTQEVQQRIFDPFFTTKPVGQGTGLGMSISYKIVVERHGGQLQCISAPGQGTEFLIYIPIQQ